MKNIIFVLIALNSFQYLIGQSGDSSVLMTIDSNKVTQEEFLRIYNKNSNIETGEKKSVSDYLDLFINYKLKVLEAERLGYDTISSFKKELKGYQDQLSKPYMENNDLFDYYTRLAYDRLTKEVNASHILIATNKDALPADTLKSYKLALTARNRILSGEPFSEVAKSLSNDPTAKQNGGSLGWFTVFQMVYPFENACYNLSVGQISMPVRTSFGYHIIQLNGVRPNRGDVLVSHIMINCGPKATEKDKLEAKEKINNAYADLQKGEKWEDVVTKYSEHRATVHKGGKLGWIKAGIVPDDFLDTCFTIDSGKYSKPFLTTFGYHIVKVDGRRAVPSFESLKDDFGKKIKSNDVVAEIAHNTLVNQIKKEYGFKQFDDNINAVYSLIDNNSTASGSWNYSLAMNMTKPIILIGSSEVSQIDLAKYISEKIFQNRGSDLATVKDKWTNEFIDNQVINYEEDQLPLKNPELKNLLDEYHDGILLFNLTEDKVWKKAVEDTIGLKNFYGQNEGKYKWKERVQIAKYSYSDTSLTPALLNLAKKRASKDLSASQLSAQLCPKDTVPCLSLTELKYEKGDNPIGDSIKWKKNAYLVTKVKRNYVLYYVEKTLSPQTKKFSEARGLYTADYQMYLEKLWILDLRSRYQIKVNNEVFENIKRKESQNQSSMLTK